MGPRGWLTELQGRFVEVTKMRCSAVTKARREGVKASGCGGRRPRDVERAMVVRGIDAGGRRREGPNWGFGAW